MPLLMCPFRGYLGRVNFPHGTYRKWSGILLILVLSCLASCRMDKRLYRPGWHVEWPSSHATIDATQPVHDDAPSAMDASVAVNANALPESMHDSLVTEQSDAAPSMEKIVHRPVHKSSKVIGDAPDKGGLVVHKESRAQKQMHPHAGLSFVMGVLAMGCILAPVLISGLGLALIVVLAVTVVVASLLAFKWSRMALEDMYMARHRYAGKALATAAMILAVLALVALIGIVVIALLGAAFLSFA